MSTSIDSTAAVGELAPGSSDFIGDARRSSLREALVHHFARGTLLGALAHGSLWSSVVSAGATAIGFIVQVLLARSLGADAYGAYTYALAWMNAALLFGKLESDTSSVRFVGAYAGTESWGLLRGYLCRVHQVIGSTAALASVGLLLVVWESRNHLAARDVAPLWLACVLLPPTALLIMQGGCLQGFHRVRAAQLPNTVLRPALFGIAVFVVVRIGHPLLDATTAIWLQVGATTVALLVSNAALRNARPEVLKDTSPRYEMRLWGRTAAGLMLVAGANVILGPQLDVLVVGSFLTTREAGIYGVASQLATFAAFGATAVVFAATPMIAGLYARKNHEALQRLLTTTVRANYALSIPALPVIAILGPRMLSWFGHPFVGGFAILVLLGSGMVLFAPTAMLAGYLMTMSGRQTQLAIVLVCAVAVNVLALLILAPRYGALGVAAATFSAGAVKSTLLAVYIRRRVGVSVLPFPRHPKSS